jgi:hypothetical protein
MKTCKAILCIIHRGKTCNAPAELVVDGKHVCWTHMMAMKNKERLMPLEFEEEKGNNDA